MDTTVLIFAYDATKQLPVISTCVILDEVPQRLFVFLQETLFDLHHVNLEIHPLQYLNSLSEMQYIQGGPLLSKED
jgi:hypothetical protein